MGRYLELIRTRLGALHSSSNPCSPHKRVFPQCEGPDKDVSGGGTDHCEKTEKSEIRVCQCVQWETFPCKLKRKCPTCRTHGICQDCGGCRWCWWLGVTGQVPAIEEEGGYGDEMPF